MGYGIYNYYGKEYHRNQWVSNTLDKVFTLIFGRSYYRETPISYSDCIFIAKKLDKFIKLYNKMPDAINLIEIKTQMNSYNDFLNSIKIDKEEIQIVKELSHFLKLSKGVIGEEEYFELFYPKVCQCSDILKVKITNKNQIDKDFLEYLSDTKTKYVLASKCCKFPYPFKKALQIKFDKPIKAINRVKRFLIGHVTNSVFNYKEEINNGFIKL